MENQMQSYSNTLMAEVSDWNQHEKEWIRLSGDDEFLKDPDFLKLRLREYERIASRFGNVVASKDNRYAMAILTYHRRKLERAIYPSRARRLLRRIVRFLAPPISAKRELEEIRQAQMLPYTRIPVPLQQSSGATLEQKQNPELHQKENPEPQQAPRQHQAPPLRSTPYQWKQKGRGRSL